MSERPARTPISAYFMAVVSCAFVTFGVMLVFAFSGALFGKWLQRVPLWVFAVVPFIAILLGLISGWQTIRQAYRKELRKAEAAEAARPTCLGCGERLEVGMKTCPVCGSLIAAE
ncbi:MAG: hypothetical protein SH850_15605 [Planctomycetaceae bacterium]|nr:hypothetical protein [Planctomycetaceae bacterium]